MINKKIDAIYIHIPFCNIKCSYCDFYVLTNMQKEYERYVEYLIKEINLYPKLKYDSIYFGGGTPSVLNISHIENILNTLEFSKDSEISLELNPTNMDYEKLKKLRSIGFNRLSIGIQSFNDRILNLMRREHNKKDAIKCYYDAKKAGFDNISIDLIFAVPTQTLEDLKNDLDKIEILKPNHISIYSLIWEEKSRFSKLLKEKKISKISEKLEEEMFLYIIDRLKKMGYTHYEVSSFCKDNKKGRHNIKYWENKEFIGVGISASSYYNGKRFEKIRKLKDYYAKIDENTIPINEKTIEIVDEKEKENLKYILGLRLLEKGVILDNKKEKIIKKLCDNKLVYVKDGKIFLTTQGLLLLDSVTLELID